MDRFDILTIIAVVVVVIVVFIILIAIISSNTNPKQERVVKIVRTRKAVYDDGKIQKIPKLIMQTNASYDIPVDMKKTIETVMDNNPEYDYIYFDDDAAKTFLEQHYGCRLVGAYNDLIPGAYRADLFRYCFLYKYGGVYIDTGMVSVTPLRELIRKDDEFVAPEDNGNGVSVYNAFMCCIPEHPIIANAIRICLKNIENRDKCSEMLYITGPGALGQAFESEIGVFPSPNTDYSNGVRIIQHIGGNRLHKDPNNIVGEIDQDGLLIMKTKYPTYYKDREWYHKKEHYGVLWNKDQVFHSVVNGIPKDDEICPQKIIPEKEDRILHEAIKHKNRHDSDKNNIKQRIPKIIIQTNELDEVPYDMYKAMKGIIKHNPEYEYFYYNADDRRQFIRNNFDNNVVRAYDSLRPGAFKADLFRYCFLYINGGVYIDSGMESIRSLRELIRSKDKLILPEDDGRERVCNGFMAAIPRHNLFKTAIEMIVKHVNDRYYGDSALDITGPNLMGKLFENIYGRKCKEGYDHNDDDKNDHVKIIKYSSSYSLTGSKCQSTGKIIHTTVYGHGDVMFDTKYKNYYIDMSWYQKKEQYDMYWQLRQVYE